MIDMPIILMLRAANLVANCIFNVTSGQEPEELQLVTIAKEYQLH